MKKDLFHVTLCVLFSFSVSAQVFSPVSTSGYNLDAVAENTTALSTTGGAIDGSDYVMYSAAYGAIYNVSTGLPNNGVIASGTRTYQLQSYSAENVLYVTAGITDTIIFTSPASFAGLSLLGFATEGSGSLDLTLEFTDNTSQFYSGQSFPDWFGSGNVVLAGFDRVTRSSGNPANTSGNPKMYSLDLPVTCSNRTKLVSRLLVHNTATSSRIVVMAVSGAGAPSFTASSTPVTCPGGTNGSAVITSTGGILPYTYTWSTLPVQNTSLAINLGAGVYTFSAQDNGGCVVVSTVSVGQNFIPEPALTLAANTSSICSGGNFTLVAAGAVSYTWNNGPSAAIYSPGPLTVSSMSVFTFHASGTTSVNCLRSGSISITVFPLPVTSFTGVLGPYCTNNAAVSLSASVLQPGGTFTGPGVNSGIFNPSMVGTGSLVLTYTKNDNNCVNSSTTSVQIFSLAAPQLQVPPPLCVNGNSIILSGSPAGGTFAGQGVNATGVYEPSLAGVGTHTVQYSTTSGVCTTSTQVNVVVNAAPMASITGKNFFCTTHNSIFFNGQPGGGTFSGPGISSNLFSPSSANIGNSNIITYSYTNLFGCSDTASLRVTVSLCAGIDEKTAFTDGLFIFPNPSQGNIILTSASEKHVIVYNELGQEVLYLFLNEGNGFRAEAADLPAGIYYAVCGGGTRPVKFLVKR